jgi:hypothetical protein
MNAENDAFARTTITVPRDLRRRMRRVGRRVNWSAVACEAFAAAIGKIESEEKGTQMMEMPSMDDAVNRLKQLKALEAQGGGAKPPGYENGFLMGRRWAMSTATPQELGRLEEFWGGRSQDTFTRPADGKQLLREMGLRIINAPADEAKGGTRQVRSLWQRVGLEERPGRYEYLGFGHGFAEGAVGFWREVKDKI